MVRGDSARLAMIDRAGFDRGTGVFGRCMITLRFANEISGDGLR